MVKRKDTENLKLSSSPIFCVYCLSTDERCLFGEVFDYMYIYVFDCLFQSLVQASNLLNLPELIRNDTNI